MGKTSKVLGKAGYSLDVQAKSDLVTITDELVSTTTKNSDNRHTGDKIVSIPGFQHSPASSPEWDERLTKVARFSSKTAESFRVLRSKILLPQDGRPAPKTIMVTSALPGEGKSFVSANLGIALAQGVDQHSLLVDCDLRLSSLARLFGISSERGLANYLQDSGELSSLIRKTSMEKLSILPSGLPPVNPAELLGSTRMHKLVKELASRYPDRYIVFDTPPFEVASESKVLSQAVDGVVLVVRQGVSGRTLLEKIVSDIGKEKIIGIIFNGQKSNFISKRLLYKSDYYTGNYYSKND